jgi:hypothetical protein
MSSTSNNDPNPEEVANEVFEDTPEIDDDQEVEQEEVEQEGAEEPLEGEGEEDEGQEAEEEGTEGEEASEEELPASVNEEPTKFQVAKNNVITAINNVLEKVNEGLINVNKMFKNKPNKSEFMDGNIGSMAEYQENLYEDAKYLEYLSFIKTFFEREKKKSQYNKSYEGGKLVLINKTDKTKKVMITPPVIVDIDTYKTYLNREIEVVLFKIVTLVESYTMTADEQKVEFGKLKSLYITFKGQLNQIDQVEKNHVAKLAALEEEIAATAIDLNVMKDSRQDAYRQIQAPIFGAVREILMKRYKENGLKPLDLNVVQEIAREHEVAPEVLEAWLGWIAKSAAYVEAQRKYTELLKSRGAEEHNHYHLMKNFIIQKPIIEFS